MSTPTPSTALLRRSRRARWLTRTLVLLVWHLASLEARADEADVPAPAAVWTTSSHLAYAVHRSSSLGFAKVGGSGLLLDVARTFGADWSFGMRTMAAGGRRSKLTFYRLASGPLLTYRPAAGWRLHASGGPFHESGLNADGATVYRSRGRLGLVGWQRSAMVLPRVAVAWGSFMTWHEGHVDAEAGPSSLGRLAAKHNTGMTQGLEVALTVEL